MTVFVAAGISEASLVGDVNASSPVADFVLTAISALSTPLQSEAHCRFPHSKTGQFADEFQPRKRIFRMALVIFFSSTLEVSGL